MFIDARSIAPGSQVRTRVAIVGAGAAGITLARELARDRIPCVLLESGGLDPDPEIQSLYEGTTKGPLDAGYLRASRLRYFGGTTNHWGGNCRPLDPIDFEARSWLANSGWPIDRAELDPYYLRAAPVCEIDPFPDPLDDLPGLAVPPLPMHDDAALRNTTFHKGPPTRFGSRYRDELESAQSVRVLLRATALGLVANATGERAESIRVASAPGREFVVIPETIVLTLGAIENARFLLLSATSSDGPHATGFGNRNDLVGRYFSEHAVLRKAAEAVLWRPEDALRLYTRPSKYGEMKGNAWGVFSPSEATLRRESLRNCTLLLQKLRAPKKDERDVSEVSSVFDRARVDAGPPGATRASIHAIFEVEPRADNRVRLGEDARDAYGQRRVELHWNPSADDFASVDRHLELFARDLGASGVGRLWIPKRQKTDEVRGNNHHLGTTRMHRDPKHGVVDADCRIHGVENVYVGGSSVFPTTGYANPTYTILALTLRLADHLRKRLATPQVNGPLPSGANG